jgi:copper(I)-binding protein
VASRSRILTSALVALIALGVSACGQGDDDGDGDGAQRDADGRDGVAMDGVAVSAAWARSSPAGVTAGAAYVTLESAVDDELTGAEVPADIAAAVEIHETVADTGAEMTMRRVSSVALPSGEAVVFGPGGLHMMLVDLAGPLQSGSTFVLTLSFATAEPQTVEVEILDEAP